MRRFVLVGAVCAAAGALAGRALFPSERVAWRAAPASRDRVVVERPAPTTGPLADEDVRRIRDAVLAALDDRDRPAEPSPPAAVEPSEPGVHASAFLDTAVGAGIWTDDDAAAFRELIVSVAPAERFELLRRWSAAINDGRLRFAGSGPLL